MTRSPAQESACKDLGRNGQSPAITSKATYTPASNRAGSRSPLTRSPAQGSECKDLGRNGQRATITPKDAYTPIPKHAGSRS
ncbi:hypothetical protein G6O48_25515, partial [Salmonella enterica subsp. enterica serovar Enteritidis]|nr:hypothetical protein [Salmonella enterica subsp. enterica serovar Enteritidis]